MKKAHEIEVNGTTVRVVTVDSEDYICLTDMLKSKDGDFFFSDWLRNRNTVEFLGVWEQVNNPNFNYGEFAIIKSQAGLNSYKLSAKEWMEKTHAIGIVSKAGRYGGTYAHKDIAFEFAMWISPEFKVCLRAGQSESVEMMVLTQRHRAAEMHRVRRTSVPQRLCVKAPIEHQNRRTYRNMSAANPHHSYPTTGV